MSSKKFTPKKQLGAIWSSTHYDFNKQFSMKIGNELRSKIVLALWRKLHIVLGENLEIELHHEFGRFYDQKT